MSSSFFHFEGARSYLMDQMGPKRPKCSSVWIKWVWLLQTCETVWNEVATSQGTSGRCIWTISRIRSGHRRCHRPSKWAKRAQIRPFCGHNHFWWLQTGGTVWNEVATSQGMSGPMHWNHFTDQKWLSRSSLVPSCATRSGSPRLPMARTLHLWPIWGLFQPLWPPGTAIPGPKIGSNRSAWMLSLIHISEPTRPY